MPEPLFLVAGLFPAYFAGQPGFSIGLIEAQIAYVLDASGWKLFKRNGVSVALIPVEAVSGLPTLTPRVDFTASKIPLDLIRRVTAFFRAVYLKHKSEAVGYLYYRSADGAWDFLPPTQTATGASASYDKAPKREGWMVAGTIHSHAAMSAFHSGTDHADEEFFDGVHITVGKLDAVPEYSCSLVIQGKREMLDPSILIDGMAPASDVPVDWVAAVKLSPPRDLGEPFAERAEKLYARYYEGSIDERAYQAQLAEIEAAAVVKKAARKKKHSASTSSSPLARHFAPKRWSHDLP